MFALALLLCALLAVAPGAWAAFRLTDAGTHFSTRIALAIVLSPLVAGVAIWILTAAGLPFFYAALVLTLISAPGLWFVWRDRPRKAPQRDWLISAACFALVAGALIALWIAIPGLRQYSWHNMMQIEAVYQAARLPMAPEEMGLAGIGLNYAWFGHIQVAAIGVLGDVSPLLIHPILNIITLLAFFLLALDAVRLLVGQDRVAIAAPLAMAALLSTNLAGVLLGYTGWLDGAGDIRLSTPIHKFMHFDLMSNGVALLMAAIVLALDGLASRTWGKRLLLLSCLAAVGLIYPLLFPAAFAVAGAAIAARPLCAWWQGQGLRLTRYDLIDITLLALPLAVWALYLRALSGGVAEVSSELVAPWQVRQRLFSGFLKGIGVWLPLLLMAAWRVWQTRDPQRLALLGAGAAMGVLYLVSILPAHVEYKFLVAALLCLLPLAVEQAIVWLDRLGKAASPTAIAIFVLIAAAIAPHIVSRHVPWRLVAEADPIGELGFALTPTEPELAWMDAVRTRTPANTMLVHPLVLAPVEPFTQRAAYLAHDDDIERPGYTMLARSILEYVKGYPEDLVARRARTLAGIYAAAPGRTAFAEIDAEFRGFRRPVALYLPRDNGYLDWLQARNDGRIIYEDDAAVVWLLGAP